MPSGTTEPVARRAPLFAVDRSSWARACDLGLDAAAAYLVMACGTGRGLRTTQWSAAAVARHTGMTRPRAGKAIGQIKAAGLLRQDREGSRPRYRLMEALPDLPADWIWMPSVVVAGTAATWSPCRHLWRTGDLPALQLLVELYGDVVDTGVVDPSRYIQFHKGFELARRNDLMIVGFRPSRLFDFGEGETRAVLERLRVLDLVSAVDHLVARDATLPLHAYAPESSDPEEAAVAHAAHHAGLRLLTRTERRQLKRDTMRCLILDRPDLAVASLLRLTHPARSEAAGRLAGWLARYEAFGTGRMPLAPR